METKELKIVPPEGYEIDKENSSLECIKFKKKLLTYEEIACNLFNDRGCYYLDAYSKIRHSYCRYCDPNNAVSEKQLEKLLAINVLMNVAKYLNGDWKPDWNNWNEEKSYIYVHHDSNKLNISVTCIACRAVVHFRTRQLAQQAINILGEDVIRLALSTDW